MWRSSAFSPKLTDSVGTGDPAALRQIKALRRAAAAREDYGQSLARLLPAAVADRLRADPGAFGRSTRLMVTVLVSDVRGYTTLVGDTVNLAQRLQDLARPAGTTLLSAATARALSAPPGFGSRECVSLGLVSVKGRVAPVEAFALALPVLAGTKAGDEPCAVGGIGGTLVD
jgi:class 3 adenylate cyclase